MASPTIKRIWVILYTQALSFYFDAASVATSEFDSNRGGRREVLTAATAITVENKNDNEIFGCALPSHPAAPAIDRNYGICPVGIELVESNVIGCIFLVMVMEIHIEYEMNDY